MQTKQQIRQLLASYAIKPNKRLGQHFLIDLNLMQKLVETAQIKSDDVILEVGCGTGSLTEELAKHADYVLAVELDKTLANIANEQLGECKNVEILCADILQNKNKINPVIIDKIKSARKKHSGRFLLVANLPYNIASPLMGNLVTGPLVADAMYVTVQKEVADRIAAGPGTKDYGTLSILLSATGDVKKFRTLKPSVFWPAPKVNSVMVSHIRKEDRAGKIKDIRLLTELVALFMQHKRKTLLSCTKFAAGKLAKIDNWPALFAASQINPKNRPAQITPAQYMTLANNCLKLLE